MPMPITHRHVLCCAGLIACLLASAWSARAEDASSGRRLYEQGVGTGGSELKAVVQGDLKVTSRALPCINCHRRSGFGTAEGPVTIPPVAGPVLFEALTQGAPQIAKPRTTGPGTRPAYTEQSLARALREGVDPAGRPLLPTMPRYEIGDADVAALSDYLRTMGATQPAGVTELVVHLATVITPGVSAARKASMLDVFHTFVRFKNANGRNEIARRDRGPWDMKGHYQTYRTWFLDEWELKGPPSEWPAQLEAFYEKTPVFALVGGISDGDWSSVDAFAAKHGIPAILPQIPLPPAPSADPFYSLYYSKGVTLEAESLAHHLASSAPRVKQVWRCGGAGASAADTLKSAPSVNVLPSECVPTGTALTPAVWRGLLKDADVAVLWLAGADLADLEALAADPTASAGVKEIYLSSSLIGDEVRRIPVALAPRTALLHPFVLPDEFEKHATRALGWMRANKINPADRQVAVNALFAVTLAADALTMPRTLSSREYFVERIEHMASRTLMPSAYPLVSFDAARRFGSLGSFVLKMPASPGEAFRKVEEWYVPGR